jgi:type I site-specific restriction endonuclease
MPSLDEHGLWGKQAEAIRNVEKSLAEDHPRSLIQMATGSGKTFTAANICYRLIKHANAERILFLVDRSNLGKQTKLEFDKFTIPETQRKFPAEYKPSGSRPARSWRGSVPADRSAIQALTPEVAHRSILRMLRGWIRGSSA